MTRDQKIADLILHGYVPYANKFGWVKIWSAERGEGRMCKYFKKGAEGPGWDVRAFSSDLALMGADEVPWHRIDDDHLSQLLLEELPPKFTHVATAADPLGQRELR